MKHCQQMICHQSHKSLFIFSPRKENKNWEFTRKFHFLGNESVAKHALRVLFCVFCMLVQEQIALQNVHGSCFQEISKMRREANVDLEGIQVSEWLRLRFCQIQQVLRASRGTLKLENAGYDFDLLDFPCYGDPFRCSGI